MLPVTLLVYLDSMVYLTSLIVQELWSDCERTLSPKRLVYFMSKIFEKYSSISSKNLIFLISWLIFARFKARSMTLLLTLGIFDTFFSPLPLLTMNNWKPAGIWLLPTLYGYVMSLKWTQWGLSLQFFFKKVVNSHVALLLQN